jgi:hypothetical protein
MGVIAAERVWGQRKGGRAMRRMWFSLTVLFTLVGVVALAGTTAWKPEIKFLKIAVATTHLAESLMTAAGMSPEKFKADGGRSAI